MIKIFKKHFIPKSIWGRFFLIIILPAILIQIITAYVFYDRHWEDVSTYLEKSVIGDISLINKMLQDKKLPNYEIKSLAAENLFIRILPYKPLDNTDDEKFDSLKLHLQKVFKSDSFIINQQNDREDIYISVNLPDYKLTFEIPRKRLYTPTLNIFIAWMLGVSTILIIIALSFTRNQVKSIERLSTAARVFGEGGDISNFKPEGAEEVRRAGYAFIAMKEKIEQQINQRTQMLAGVSHDLKTPLTRIKLSLAMFPKNDETDAIQSDITEMQHIIDEYLQFAGQIEVESKQKIDIIGLLQDIVIRYKSQGAKLKINKDIESCMIFARPVSMRRAFTNIIDNGLKYGEEAEITVHHTRSRLTIIIEDNGSGIKPEEHEKVFSAFYRSDYARNMSDKKQLGAGLGLAIARDIFNAHGAKIKVNKTNLKLKGASIEIQFKI
ncbi:MAG: ATP-binding protein [Alphaproteobacteria bacterium]|nr:ATP-binding protein [Alphaproteobacteria bacterium]OJV13883.1 MAG: hypothetical protein BGO27_08310 [Alphaproteobacteria bacterium 33-17]